jgi:hypothetical protein
MPPFDCKEDFKISKRRLNIMIRGHELALDLLRNKALPDALEKLKDPEVRNKIRKDPMGYAREQGLTMPENADISLRELRSGFEIEIDVFEGPTTYMFGFNSAKGFYIK